MILKCIFEGSVIVYTGPRKYHKAMGAPTVVVKLNQHTKPNTKSKLTAV